jgi:hypothetical protein
VIIAVVQYVIAAEDKKDEVISVFKSPRYVAIKKTATLMTFVAKSGFSEDAAYLRTPLAMVPTPQILQTHLVK